MRQFVKVFCIPAALPLLVACASESDCLESVRGLARSGGVGIESLECPVIKQGKDPGAEWLLVRRGDKLFAGSPYLGRADSMDWEYYSGYAKETWPGIDLKSYYLLRGEMTDSAFCPSKCNLYVFESESSARVYGELRSD